MNTTQHEPPEARRAGATTACAAVLVLATGACAIRTPPPPTRPSAPSLADAVVDLAREWTDTGLVVRKGDRLVFWATGEIRDLRRPDRVAGPDGINPSTFRVGRGGLMGRVGNEKPFDVGARTHLIWKGAFRSYRLVTPAPLEISVEGPLRLGVRDWRPGRYAGTFAVSIWRAPVGGTPPEGLVARLAGAGRRP